MAVTQDEIDSAPRCPVCSSPLVYINRYVACAEGLEHTKLLQTGEDGKRLNRVAEVAGLPVATKLKKDSQYEVDGKVYGRCRVNSGEHWPGEIVARTECSDGWYVIRLVPVE